MEKKKPGRRKIHKDNAERMRKLRMQEKMEGKKVLSTVLPKHHKELLDRLCKDLNLSIPDAICYLLECAYDRELPNLTHCPDSASDQETHHQSGEG